MAICDPTANPPLPAWLSDLDEAGASLTPAMRAIALTYANDMTVAIGTVTRQWVNGLPLAFVTNCHSYTTNPDGTETQGAYHGTSVWYINDPDFYPPGGPAIPPPAASSGAGLAVGAAAAGLLAFLVLRPR